MEDVIAELRSLRNSDSSDSMSSSGARKEDKLITKMSEKPAQPALSIQPLNVSYSDKDLMKQSTFKKRRTQKKKKK